MLLYLVASRETLNHNFHRYVKENKYSLTLNFTGVVQRAKYYQLKKIMTNIKML